MSSEDGKLESDVENTRIVGSFTTAQIGKSILWEPSNILATDNFGHTYQLWYDRYTPEAREWRRLPALADAMLQYPGTVVV
jgi:hypothetical protein